MHTKCTRSVYQDITRQRYRVDTPKHQIPRSDIGYPMLDMGLPSVCTQAHQCVCVHYVCSLKEHYRGMHLKGHTHIHVVHIKCIRSVRQDITRQGYRVDGLNIRSKIRDRISEIRCWISDSVSTNTHCVFSRLHVCGACACRGDSPCMHSASTRWCGNATPSEYEVWKQTYQVHHLMGWSGNPDIRKSDLPIQYPKIRYSDLRDYLVCSRVHSMCACVHYVYP